jgi:hypothetical protein
MTVSLTPRPDTGRTCGSCMMCCKVPHIRELNKAPGAWCIHAIKGRGCGIHGNHPVSCREFHCLWMVDASLGPEWKPDRAKFVIHLQPNGVNLQVAVDPGFPNAWTKPPYYDQLKRWARGGAERGALVFVRIGPRMIALLPDRDHDMGSVGLDDEILIKRRLAPSGFEYEIEVKRPNEAATPRRQSGGGSDSQAVVLTGRTDAPDRSAQSA